jgi:tripeptide aminopeptidase
MKEEILERFLRYVKVDTESLFGQEQIPSTVKQLDLANILVQELRDMGMQEVTLDENCYVMATLPSNIEIDVPTIGFVAHMDTSPDFTGKNVNPQVHRDYDGGDIVLNTEKNIILSSTYFKDLEKYKGQTIITTDGLTLLGADDKAGVTEIMVAMKHLIDNPTIKHGKIRICFTPDEEVGRGADKFDVEKFGAEWAYTMDGSRVGELEYESFNASYAAVTFYGRSVHPGYAKNKMVNSIHISREFMDVLPSNEVPEQTEGYEGFYHLMNIKGGIEETTLNYIIRDHDMDKFKARKEFFESCINEIKSKFGEESVKLEMKDQYYNMGEKIKPVYHIVEIAEQALKDLNIKPLIKPIRGGTDGSRLSYMGLPCPNIFAGGHNFHGKFEYVPLESMEKATNVIIRIAELVGSKN